MLRSGMRDGIGWGWGGREGGEGHREGSDTNVDITHHIHTRCNKSSRVAASKRLAGIGAALLATPRPSVHQKFPVPLAKNRGAGNEFANMPDRIADVLHIVRAAIAEDGEEEERPSPLQLSISRFIRPRLHCEIQM